MSLVTYNLILWWDKEICMAMVNQLTMQRDFIGGFVRVKREGSGSTIFNMVCLALATGNMSILIRDPELVRRIGAATALEVRATGITYAFAPCIAVCRDPRWGRCYESYSEDPKVQEMTDIISGLQGKIPNGTRKGVPYVAGKNNVVACAKHFVGDGGTTEGINERNTVIDMHRLLNIHMPPYYDSVIKGVSTVMVSYTSWNNKKMHANRDLISGFLKDTLNFKNISMHVQQELIYLILLSVTVVDCKGCGRRPCRAGV